MKSKLIFPVVVFVELFVLNFANTRNIFQVILEFFIDEFHEILSCHLILDIEFRLHLVEECLLDDIASFFRIHVCHRRLRCSFDFAHLRH